MPSSRKTGAHWPTNRLAWRLPASCSAADMPAEPTAAHRNVSDGSLAVCCSMALARRPSRHDEASTSTLDATAVGAGLDEGGSLAGKLSSIVSSRASRFGSGADVGKVRGVMAMHARLQDWCHADGPIRI